MALTGADAAGLQFSLPDAVLGLSVHRWVLAPMARPQWPDVEAYHQRLSERPGFMLHGRNGLP